MNNTVEQSLETVLFHSINTGILMNEIGEEQKENVYNSNIIIEDNYGRIKVIYLLLNNFCSILI